MADVFISTGEASGDAVGAGIARGLFALRPELSIEGIGAARMHDAGVRLWADSKGWAAIGVAQAIPMIGKMLALQRRLKKYLTANPPKALVLVDFGAFNVRLGTWAKAHGIRTIYAMPPSSWRKRVNPERTRKLAEAADLFLSPFAWNAENLRAAGASVIHIGHPVLDLSAPTSRAAVISAQARPENGRLIALLPGSRWHEVETLAPRLVAVAKAWPYPQDRFVKLRAPSFSEGEFARILRERAGWSEAEASNLRVVQESAADVFTAADMATVCAGTATLEAAVVGKPMAVVYDGPWVMRLEWRMRRKRVNAPMIAMPNIIAGERIVPELIAEEATSENIIAALKTYADDPESYETAARMLADVRIALCPEGALAAAAHHIIEAAGL